MWYDDQPVVSSSGKGNDSTPWASFSPLVNRHYVPMAGYHGSQQLRASVYSISKLNRDECLFTWVKAPRRAWIMILLGPTIYWPETVQTFLNIEFVVLISLCLGGNLAKSSTKYMVQTIGVGPTWMHVDPRNLDPLYRPCLNELGATTSAPHGKKTGDPDSNPMSRRGFKRLSFRL